MINRFHVYIYVRSRFFIYLCPYCKYSTMSVFPSRDCRNITDLHNLSISSAIIIAIPSAKNCTSQSFFDDLGTRNENKIIQNNLEVEI